MIVINEALPGNCVDCWIRQNLGCRVANAAGWPNNKRANNCPIVDTGKDDVHDDD